MKWTTAHMWPAHRLATATTVTTSAAVVRTHRGKMFFVMPLPHAQRNAIVLHRRPPYARLFVVQHYIMCCISFRCYASLLWFSRLSEWFFVGIHDAMRMHFQFRWRQCSARGAPFFLVIFIFRLRSHQYPEMTSIFNERIFSDFNLLCSAQQLRSTIATPLYTHRLIWVCQSKWVEWWNKGSFCSGDILFIFEIEKKNYT